jgi:uncharacterized membrane protein YesL
MEAYYSLGKLIVFIALLSQCLILAIQAWALKRHRKRCFTLLTLGALFGIIYAVIAGLPYFIHFDMPAHLLIQKLTLGLLVCGSVLGIWGMALLVRSYSDLAERVSPSAHANT